jgi:hypothetical protein
MNGLVCTCGAGSRRRHGSAGRGEMTVRTATCQCGAFSATATGEPELVGACHCTECQRRSGVPVTCNAYFRKANVRLEGEHRIYSRNGQDDRKLNNHFCPVCGSTVCWTLDLRPDHYGIAVGAFNDRTFPAPSYSVWEASKYFWVVLPEGVELFERNRLVGKT